MRRLRPLGLLLEYLLARLISRTITVNIVPLSSKSYHVVTYLVHSSLRSDRDCFYGDSRFFSSLLLSLLQTSTFIRRMHVFYTITFYTPRCFREIFKIFFVLNTHRDNIQRLFLFPLFCPFFAFIFPRKYRSTITLILLCR